MKCPKCGTTMEGDIVGFEPRYDMIALQVLTWLLHLPGANAFMVKDKMHYRCPGCGHVEHYQEKQEPPVTLRPELGVSEQNRNTCFGCMVVGAVVFLFVLLVVAYIMTRF